ncbi:alpha/beta hydrolase family protein [Lysobacter enzymogenes]|uniref:alpha/beta hydrolase family protein n=1 Tax=Lysobacter enzymogenes TaxID=69 RepID=UPI000899A45B|nr:S9 family peptidase [Lysobacter enzymogenes]SDY05770.1 Dipeptidyl aminopeptidase/acylaminoacyl peptidase [Lysobacter enzymogenes]
MQLWSRSAGRDAAARVARIGARAAYSGSRLWPALAAALALSAAPAYAQAPAAGTFDIEGFVKPDTIGDIKLSPTGEFYAASVPLENETALVIFSRDGLKRTGTFRLGKHNHVDDFQWVSPTRVLMGMAQKLGSRDEPIPTGEIYAINANGSGADVLVGYRVASRGAGTRIQPKKVEDVAAFLVDELPGEERSVVISVQPFTADAYSRAERLDVFTGQRNLIALSPVRNTRFATDNAGVVRFAYGFGSDRLRKLFYRANADAPWKQIAGDDDGVEGMDLPIGFSADDKTAYFRTEHAKGPDAIVAYDVASGKRSELLRDPVADPDRIIYRNDSRVPVGAFFANGKPRTVFFDKNSPEARQYKSLEAAFPGDAVRITSSSADGELSLVEVWNDRNPGDIFLFDNKNKNATHVISRRTWFDPANMATVKPVELRARDGLALHGYLTLPKGSEGKSLPMVVMPHGGPYNIQDRWQFDDDAQLLAAAGYVVLQVNFRGSSGYGDDFVEAGRRQWGGTMQDDVTDATRWAIAQGIADAGRVCIYGASYGGYAALMGAAREPSLYKCAAGYVGVYDLPLMHTRGDTQDTRSGATYLREWIGAPEAVDKVSPTRLAAQIKVPVFLAAGGEDQRAPQLHSERMEKALREAGVPVESLYYKTEGHGFYEPAHKREFYSRLLAFLSKSLGGKTAAPAPAAATAAEKK